MKIEKRKASVIAEIKETLNKDSLFYHPNKLDKLPDEIKSLPQIKNFKNNITDVKTEATIKRDILFFHPNKLGQMPNQIKELPEVKRFCTHLSSPGFKRS